MEQHLGWIHGSDMPQTYIHMSGKEVDDAILKMHGFKKEEETQPELTARQCPRCDEMNGPTSKFCSRCGAALDTQTAMEIDEGRSDVMNSFMNLIQENPEIIDMLNKFKEQNESKSEN
jgi:phage FluMu protein Com